MRQLSMFGMALACLACTTTEVAKAPPAAARTEPPSPVEAVHDVVLSEAATVASQVVERDGMTCLQGLDSYGNVVEEHCEVTQADR